MGSFQDLAAMGVDADGPQARALEAQAERCRRLASALSDARTVTTLTGMATEYEAQARELREG
jgi:hypothetical protein